MTLAAIVLAAGRGTRAGSGAPKQWRLLQGRPILHHALQLFTDRADIDRVILVVHPDDASDVAQITHPKVQITTGGATRAQSVKNGLAALTAQAPDYVLIHDGARPLTPQPVIDAVIAALPQNGAAAPALLVTDSLWRGNSAAEVIESVPREGLYRAQTPQGFSYRLICAAHEAETDDATDDVAVMRAAGHKVAITAGSERNLKITHPEDFARAEHMMRTKMDIRTGNGFDVHRLCEGDHVWLCGVKIPHTHGLDGHSDADVGMHAVTDAIYGALAAGDIGRHFPPSDMQWKGAPSDIFLRHAVDLAKSRGFTITHLDCTLICEYPKIGPYGPAMQARMAEITGLDLDRISVKATTSERLGFTGRSEGIASLATATLVKL